MRGDDAEAGGLRAYADELRSNFLRLQQEAPAVHAKARSVQVTERSPDGLVTATVGARGDLIRLDLDPRIYRRQHARALADSIAETIQRAADKAQAKVVEHFEPLVAPEQMKLYLEGDLEAVLDQMSGQLPKER
ncbi:YbaB/EbfC family nucleoid-associated protein [Streptosporangium sp. KLBMP 9127]|nr:YbaB/EbfC family nucleoid-associated protein [Streptosporangium sp. KLBMP 9127]